MKILKTFILVLLTLPLNGQRFSWGIPVKHDKIEFSGQAIIKRFLLKETEDGITRLRVEKGGIIHNANITLERYDANLELQDTDVVFEGDKMNRHYSKLVVVEDKFIIFYTLAGRDKTNALLAQAYDFEGEKIGEEKKLDVIKNTKNFDKGYFEIAVSQNKQHFATIGIPLYKKKTNEWLQIKTYDADLNEVFSDKFTLQNRRKRFTYNTPFIMNDGTFFMDKNHKVKKVGRVRQLFVLDKAAKKLIPNKLALSGNNHFVAYNNNSFFENSKGELIIAGLQRAKGKLKAAKGVFYLAIDKTGKVVKEVNQDLKLPKFGFSLKKVVLLENDDLLYLGHQFDESEVAENNNIYDKKYVYKAEGIYVVRLRGDELVWSQYIKREPLKTKEDRGRLLDFVWYHDREGDNLVILFNDLHHRHVRGIRKGTFKIPMLAYIAKDGSYSVKPLTNVDLGKYKDTYTFCPDEFYQRGNYLILKCSNNIDFKLGRFSL